MRSALVTALVARAECSLRSRLRRFLRGLSCDELQFIASFLGACILESSTASHGPGCLCGEAAGTEWEGSTATRSAEDRDLKMILLIEYLCRSGQQPTSVPLNPEARLS